MPDPIKGVMIRGKGREGVLIITPWMGSWACLIQNVMTHYILKKIVKKARKKARRRKSQKTQPDREMEPEADPMVVSRVEKREGK